MLGRTANDTADLLEIGVRTVKLHQADVLEKRGPDSRIDPIIL